MTELTKRFARYEKNIPEITGKRSPATLRRYREDALVEGNLDIIQKVDEMVNFAVRTFGNHYSHDIPQVQLNAAPKLISLMRSQPELTTLKSSEKLLNLTHVGPYMALTILKEISQAATSLSDFTDERREKYAKRHQLSSKTNLDIPFHPGLYLDNRDSYQLLARDLIPSSIARLISRDLTVEEFEKLSRVAGSIYAEIWEMASGLLPLTENPYFKLRPTRISFMQ